ncbi:MAG TPA: S41 family peptidase [Anaerolineales bacterium]|nr:S41 family peptidase [Anaerolineales bacterium]
MSLRARFAVLLITISALTCQSTSKIWQSLSTQSNSPTTSLYALDKSTIVPASLTPTYTVSPSTTSTFTASPSPSPTLTTTPTKRPTPSPHHLQVFDEIWNTVNENYLYSDFNGVDWYAINNEYRHRIESGLNDDEFYLAMDEMISKLGDEHSKFFNPEQVAAMDIETESGYDYVGIGILSTALSERDYITIILTFPGGPAEEFGLQSHDNILEVDGHAIIDETGIRYDLLRGIEGSQAVLTVQSPGGEPRYVNIVRSLITGSIPVPNTTLTTQNGNQIGYILIPTFTNNNIDEQIKAALIELTSNPPLDGLIIDNRQNRGGGSDVFMNSIAYFTSGILGHFIDRENERPLSVKGENVYGSQEIPLVVLIGRDTVSFGEVFAGILQDIGRAYLIGEQTDGNVEVLHVFDFTDGSRAWIAQETFRPLNHPQQDWEISGIIPDQTIISYWDEVVLDTDPAVIAALKYFDKK